MEKSLSSLPVVGVPTNFSDMVVMELQSRIPGRLPRNAAKVGEVGLL